jgi:multidrug efflux pump subunit AcrB
MRISRFFIERPIFAAVVALVVTIVGGIGYFGLGIAQLPEIAPPTITVSTSYPGASAQTVADTVAAPIEQEVNGVEGMIYMASQSTSDGNLSVTVTFDVGTDIDRAQVLVQNRVSAAERRLPE